MYNEYAAVGKSHGVWINLTSGSDYHCDVDMGNSDIQQTNETQTPVSGSNLITVYPNEQAYTVTVTCYNNVSLAGTTLLINALEPITGIQLNPKGAIKGQDFNITFTINTGSNPTFTLTLGGVDKPTTYSATMKTGSTINSQAGLATGEYPVEIHGVNLISDEMYYDNFTIDEYITNLSCAPDDQTVVDILTNECVDFCVEMTGGTSVTVDWDYCSQGADSFFAGPVVGWPGQQCKNRCFNSPGVCTVQITIANNFETFVKSMTVNVFNKVGNLTFECDSPVPYFQITDTVGSGTVNIRFNTMFSSDPGPTIAFTNITWGDGDNSMNVPFVLSQAVSHTYTNDGTYTLSGNVFNKISEVMFDCTVYLAEPVVDFKVTVNPPVGVAVYSVAKVVSSIERGVNVTFYWECGATGNVDFSKQRECKWHCVCVCLTLLIVYTAYKIL